MNRFDWDDLRFVLAVAQAGSLSGAARALGVNHATVLRRVSGFEARTGVTLFERAARGLSLAPRRQGVIAAMRKAEEAMLGVSRALTAAQSPVAGLVRVTSTDTLCQTLLPPIVARLIGEAEGLTIELSATNQHLDLARPQAHIALRASPEAPPGLFSEVAGTLGFAVYAAPGTARGWLVPSGPIRRAAPAGWIEENVDPARITGRADSFVVMGEMAAAGMGKAILPTILGARDSRLVRLPGLIPDFATRLWVTSHPDLAKVERIRVVRAMLIGALRREIAAFGPIQASEG